MKKCKTIAAAMLCSALASSMAVGAANTPFNVITSGIGQACGITGALVQWLPGGSDNQSITLELKQSDLVDPGNTLLDPIRPEPPETPPVQETPPEPETPPAPEAPDNAADGYAEEVARLVNAERVEAGLAELTVDTKVQEATQVRAEEQIELFSHTRPDGTSCFTALEQAGASYSSAGENIAYGQSTPEEVMQSWMNSPGHKANILNPQFTNIGVGVAESGGRYYWAQMFTS